ncbi:MAG: DUF937 domain-containing protein [Actinomycetota bacterium]|nr:DUF937 domain-containing protein [Actinomycetota bacterium]
MASMIESVMNMLGGDTLDKISQQVGVPKDKAKQALPDVMAVITGALAKNSKNEQEAKSISNALAKDHDGSVLNNISDYISNYRAADGDGILKHVLGDKRAEVEQSLSKKEGLDIGSISNMLTMAAPIIMGMLGKKQQQEGLSASALSSILGQESNQAQSLFPNMGDILGQVLGGMSQSQGTTPTTPAPQQPPAAGTTKKRSGCATVMIVLVIALVVYFALRACGIM